MAGMLLLIVVVCAFALSRGLTTWVEAIGFVTGAVCVYLAALDNVWNWPIGIVNSIAYIILFGDTMLIGDKYLNVVYLIFGFLGWYWWLRGGEKSTKLVVNSTPQSQWLAIGLISVVATASLTRYFYTIHDAAPFLDAFTTVFSLVAQYMLTRKYIENWLFWILVDVMYVPLYLWKGLYLTGVLYAIFTFLAVAGLAHWAKLRGDDRPPLWRPTWGFVAIGSVSWALLTFICFRFEAGNSSLGEVRASTSATVRLAHAAEATPLDDTTFNLLKAELLDPLHWSTIPAGASEKAALPYAVLQFSADKKPTVQYDLDSARRARSSKGDFVIATHWYDKLDGVLARP